MLACVKSLALNEGSQVALGLTLFKERMRERKRSAEVQKNWHNIHHEALGMNTHPDIDREIGDRKKWEVRKDMHEDSGHLKIQGVQVVEGGLGPRN